MNKSDFIVYFVPVFDSFNPACKEIIPKSNNNHICLKITNKLNEIQHPCLMIYYAFDKNKRVTATIDCKISLSEITLLAKWHFSSFTSRRSP